jgi:DNA-binding FadR family transcriptional regulator
MKVREVLRRLKADGWVWTAPSAAITSSSTPPSRAP